MANPERGEVDLVVGDRTLTLSLTTNDLCELQAKTGKTYGEMVASFTKFDFVMMRDLLACALKRHHAKEFPKLTDVGNLMDSCGGALEMLRTFRALADVNRRLGSPGGDENPPTAQVDGTGIDSTLTPAASA